MNEQALEQRKVELKKQLDQVLANANALHGAIQEVDFWIASLEPKKEQEAQCEKQ